MPFRSTVVDPESLTMMAAAFEDAWMVINAKGPVPLRLQPSARDYLGYVIFALWRRGYRSDLAIQAVAEYGRSPKWGSLRT